MEHINSGKRGSFDNEEFFYKIIFTLQLEKHAGIVTITYFKSVCK